MKELIIIQSSLKAPKNQRNNFGNYNYRSAEDILEAVKPLLFEQACLLTISDEIIEVCGRVYVKATATLKGESGEISVSANAREEETKKGMDAAQITGSASSYARKYALNGLFAIDDTKDPDSTNKHDNSGKSLDQILKKINSANGIDELISIWNNNVEFQGMPLFKNSISKKKASYGTQAK